MKRLTVTAVVLALALAVAGTAYAYDCIRVSTSAAGVRESAKSGNWLPFILDTGPNVDETFNSIFGLDLTDAQAACLASHYAESGQPRYFSLGIGVAGGKKETITGKGARGDNYGVLIWNQHNFRILSDGRGVDHVEDSDIVPALVSAADACAIVIPEE